jgi:hypothetical protein
VARLGGAARCARTLDYRQNIVGTVVSDAIAAGQLDRFALAAEAIHFAASEAYEQHSGDAEAFWEALEAAPDDPGDEEEPPDGERWSGRFGGADDLARIRQRLARLLALFPERALGER